jgi:hypothetical protein
VVKNKVKIVKESKITWIHDATDDKVQIFDFMVDGCVVGRVSINLNNDGSVYIMKSGKVSLRTPRYGPSFE